MLRKSYIVVVLSLIAMFGASADAALNAYLTLKVNGDQIDGGVTQAGREGQMEIYGFSHTVVAPRDAASGLPTGKRQHLPVTITKPIDKATPLILQALVNNDVLEATLDFVRPDPNNPASGAEQHYYTIELTNANIAGIRQEMLNNKYTENSNLPVMEKITFTYQTVERRWEPDSSVPTGRDTWDVDNGGLPVSDLNFDNRVNIVDMALLAQEFLMEGSFF
jgi:type VI secretion system secreted protein Hcp